MKLNNKKIEEQLTNKDLLNKIEQFNKKLLKESCSDVPHAFWHRKKHMQSIYLMLKN